MYNVMLSANSDNFTSFPLWIPFISFSALTDVAKNSKTMLNSSGESSPSISVLFDFFHQYLYKFQSTALLFP